MKVVQKLVQMKSHSSSAVRCLLFGISEGPLRGGGLIITLSPGHSLDFLWGWERAIKESG